MKEQAEKIIADNFDQLGEIDLDNVLWTLNNGLMCIFVTTPIDEVWQVHVAADRGSRGTSVFVGFRAAERWFKELHPECKKLVAIIRSENTKAVRAAVFAGFNLVPETDDKYGMIMLERGL